MMNFKTFKQNVNSLSNETKLSVLSLFLSIYLLGIINIVIPAELTVKLFIILYKNNDRAIRIIANGAFFSAGAATLLSLYGAAIAFDKTDGVLSESYSYPFLFYIFSSHFICFLSA
ncbi:MAG: hypothetical protein LBU81_00290 [Methanosarcinales archaeon]|nr:hypothetical protein [Methanosarcinales archaeon]